jgi:hypothetical protein
LTLATAVDPGSVSGYVVGRQDLLKVERASTGEYFINNAPAGKLDIILVAQSSLSLLWSRFLATKEVDVGIRLNKVDVLNGVRTTKDNVTLPKLASVSGKVMLAG